MHSPTAVQHSPSAPGASVEMKPSKPPTVPHCKACSHPAPCPPPCSHGPLCLSGLFNKTLSFPSPLLSAGHTCHGIPSDPAEVPLLNLMQSNLPTMSPGCSGKSLSWLQLPPKINTRMCTHMHAHTPLQNSLSCLLFLSFSYAKYNSGGREKTRVMKTVLHTFLCDFYMRELHTIVSAETSVLIPCHRCKALG